MVVTFSSVLWPMLFDIQNQLSAFRKIYNTFTWENIAKRPSWQSLDYNLHYPGNV